MGEKEVRFGYEIRRLDNAIKRRVGVQLRESGIDEGTAMNGWVLKYLYDNRDSKVYQKDIERHFRISRSTVAGIIKQLEQSQCIRRESVENDARLKRVILLPKGEEIHKTIKQAFTKTDTQLIEMLSQQELETFLQILKKIINHLDSKER